MRTWPAPDVPVLARPAGGRLRLTDTASGRLQDAAAGKSEARLYVCGITPYDATHLGHAFTYVTFDLAHRVWRDLGQSVAYTQNVTDVDDPLLERAAATGVDWRELAAGQIDLFRSDMAALRVLPPQPYVGVVESLDVVTAFLGRLAAAGAVYQADDPAYPDWYFATAGAPGLGQVAHLDEAAMLAVSAERGGDPGRPGKRAPLDPLVWRLARPGEPAWDTPLGRGRPGWHVECAALALDSLGPAFDVQGGGSDLVFPHHELCAAEASAVTGQAFAAAYVHVAMVGLDGEKMSKSRGNLGFVSELLAAGADPMAVRLALLGHHYRTEWSWTADDLAVAETRLARWRAAARVGGAADPARLTADVRAGLQDDLHADRALAAVDEWADASLASAAADPVAAREAQTVLDALLGVLL
ncbi:MAG: cysteine--1-D-myo-inosityl 2-amino-2-deoxy-alpha-D-glucopyranoside ligase [Propionibacteriaceae bacterium]|jgi:L-cysteine:1D-myo-inositol 2-amino-2-deoxy-alpha-D-glucopyranoside ligase|nr:cysteine--1-D-myo-inosityl 2-amino-2-deoxy-alpha-D-glucopyranoside ligase [Propionibacteriaceae bacterium]